VKEEPLLRRIAKRMLGEEKAKIIWKRIEIVGDIAVIRKPFELDLDTIKPLGEELLKELKYVKSVWVAVSPVKGDVRLRDYVHVAGEKRSETTYKEHGCVFLVDITKVYISPVLGYDHMRTARLIKNGEKVFNMFAGFGPYSIIISKYAKPSYVLSADINPHAVRYARINIEINKVAQINEAVLADSLLLAEGFEEKFDRVLMPYPELFERALPKALKVVKPGGYIHPHIFVDARSKKEALDVAAGIVKKLSEKYGYRVDTCGGHVIRGVAPRRYHVVLDLKVSSKP